MSTIPETTDRFLKELSILAHEEAFAIKSQNYEYIENLQPLKSELIEALVKAADETGVNAKTSDMFRHKFNELLKNLEKNGREVEKLSVGNQKKLKDKQASLHRLERFKDSYQANNEKKSRVFLNA